ncbi:MAG: penicillin-binding protein 1C [Magnetococcales bacterium]|nr:penicillin-binding protein 1C [Magnetococcales bacterium]
MMSWSKRACRRLFPLFLGSLLGPLPVWAEIPSFESVRDNHQSSDLLVLDRHGEPLQQLRIDATRRQLAWTPLDAISPVLLTTLLAAEDRHFWQHGGVAWSSLVGAVWDRLFRGIRRGASTLTMQLAALLDPRLQPTAGRRTWRQKLAQIEAARTIEQGWSKGQILEGYLNLVSFRGEVRGIQAASRTLFDKLPSGLETPEALLLTALLRSPNASARKTAERACVLARRHTPDIPCPLLQELAARSLAGSLPPVRPEASLAPHAAQWLLAHRAADDNRRQVITTLDASLQRFASDTLTRHLRQLQGRNVSNGAVLVVDNATGDLLAYVGGDDNHTPTRHVDGVRAPRQAGSTLKPFLYQLAIEQKLLTAASLLEDSPLELATPRGNYVPQNYDPDFKGWVTLRTALAASLNVPAVRALLLAGLDPFVARLRQLGYAHVTEEGAFYGYALALGSVEVSLWQQVAAYRTLATGGVTTPLRLRLDEPALPATRILAEPAAFIVADILADPLARSLTFGIDSPLETPFWSAVKTGTSKHMRDNWCIGFSRRYTVGVWVGNFDGQPMHEVSGITGAAPTWLEIMNHLHPAGGHVPSLPPDPPPGVTSTQTTFLPPLESPRPEWFMADTEMPLVQLNDAAERPTRILHPRDGTIMALDPDIPPGQQRLFPRMDSANSTLRWRLDSQPLDPTQAGWPLTRGEHRLELIDRADKVVDGVRFQVRGSVMRKF